MPKKEGKKKNMESPTPPKKKGQQVEFEKCRVAIVGHRLYLAASMSALVALAPAARCRWPTAVCSSSKVARVWRAGGGGVG